MNETFINYAMQISLILFSGIYAISVSSHSGDKKHNNNIYPYISPIIFLGLLPILNYGVTNSDIGLVSLYTLITFKLINSISKSTNDKKWISIAGFLVSIFIIVSLNSYAFIKYISSLNAFLIFTAIMIVHFVLELKSDDSFSKFSNILPLAIASTFVFLNDFSVLAYLLFIVFALLDARKLYQDIKNTKSEFEARLELLEKDFTNELEKGVRKRTFYVERLKDRMAEVNRVDHLTKALNRKAITTSIDDLVMAADVTHFVMLLFDIDKFKNINDTYGHVTGDVCLKNLATIAFKNIRNVDFLGRYGGDEFIILLPNQTLKEGLRVAERFRMKVAETQNPHFTVSIGASAYPWDGETMTSLLSTADKGLYVAKENNRNKVSYDGYIKLEDES
ncbi:MAG: GGDEF domain-containing protein [Acidaminobacteraceae bacterium]